MSWDAMLLREGEEISDLDWNFTHNTSCMIYAALDDAGRSLGVTWWKHLNGLTGAEGCEYLSTIIVNLRADPDRFRAMNPPNGWGNYDALVDVLTEMRDACLTEEPMRWWASG